MSDPSDWAFPEDLQPDPRRQRFDLDAALASVVAVRADIPGDAFTASTLGTERAGSGVLIRAGGLVLTIGYLITEARSIWLTGADGRVVPGHAIGQDQATGFGLVQTLGRLDLPAIELGSAAGLAVGDDVVVMGHGGRAHALQSKVIAKREFAGYWEYLLDEALFTAPAHPQWGGTAVVDADGRLVGIGSLLVDERVGRKSVQGNMIVPIDLLPPILEDMLARGASRAPARPWLGLYAGETKQNLLVGGLAKGGPADKAGLQEGDLILEVADSPVKDLARFFRKVWSLGPAGTEIPLTIQRRNATLRVHVASSERSRFLKQPSLH
jgi:S1-C subfamily serine protease